MTTQEQVAGLLDTPVTILERIYDLAMVRLPSASGDLRKARLATVEAVGAYELAYRKAQLEIMAQADKDGVKITEGKRELAAKDKVADESMAAMIAKAQEGAAQDLLFELKDQLTALYSMLSWKQTELKNTCSSVNAPPRYTNQDTGSDDVDFAAMERGTQDDLTDFEAVGA